MPHTARVITVSDRSAAGLREDRGGPLAVSRLRDAGFVCGDPVVVPDGADNVEAALRAAVAAGT
ncbi:molybdopterin-binding protein, partial [Acinetobacter baumannii]